MDDQMTSRSLFSFFLKNTTLPALPKIPNRRTIFLKVFWTTLLVLLFGICVWEAVQLAQEHLRFLVYQSVRVESKSHVIFPSVTVCSNQPINWKRMIEIQNPLVEQINQSLENVFKGKNLSEKSKLFEGNEVLMKYLRNLTYDQRSEFAYQKEEFIKFCSFERQPCTEDDFLIYNNLHYGNCFTFNPGFIEEKEKLTKTKDGGLILAVEMERDIRYPYLRREIGPLIYIHETGSSPLMDPRLTFVAYPGNWNFVKLRQKEMKRLPEPYASTCIDLSEKSVRKNLFQYTDSTPYFYTLDACLVSCSRNSQMELCGCIHEKYISHNKTFFYPACDSLNECKITFLTHQENDICDCYLPCHEVYFTYERQTDREWLDYPSNQKQLQMFFTTYRGDSKVLAERFKYNVSVIEVYFKSKFFETKLEIPKDELYDTTAAIGGNVGLLVGISLVSITELIELLFLQLRQMYRKWNENKKLETTQKKKKYKEESRMTKF